MKNFTTTFLLLLVCVVASAQSKSFTILQERFEGHKDVYSFQTSGGLARFILRVSGEHDFTDAIEDVKSVRFIIIPKAAFKEQDVTVRGFKKFAAKDGFVELGYLREKKNNVTVMLQEGQKNRDNRYLLVVDDGNEVVAIEVKGYIDPAIIRKDISYNQH